MPARSLALGIFPLLPIEKALSSSPVSHMEAMERLIAQVRRFINDRRVIDEDAPNGHQP